MVADVTIARSKLLGERASADVRDSMPTYGPLALAMTLLTGKPHTGQRELNLRPGFHVVGAFLSILSGLAISATSLAMVPGGSSALWLLLLVPGWAATLHGMRNLRMMIYHQAAHQNLWGRSRLDRIIGQIVTPLLIIEDFDRYRREHVADHHAIHHMTVRDPTVQAFLIGLRLAPGMSRQQMWRRVILRLVSPVFHMRFFIARVRSLIQPAAWPTRLSIVGCYSVAAALVTWQGLWLYVLVCWFVPLTVPYQISNTLRLCVKHTFPPPDAGVRKGREYFASLTNAIFLGEPTPAADQSEHRRNRLRHAGRWARWWYRMLLVHFPIRYLILTGDTVCHDYHHRRPMDRKWSNYIFARQRDIDEGHRGWPEYRAVWGLVPAIDTVFDSLSVADASEFNISRIADVSSREVFAAFDD